MIEDALELANTFMVLLHRKMIMEFVRKYAQQFQESTVTKP
jgi:hypothetical protein